MPLEKSSRKLLIQDICFSFGRKVLFDHVSLTLGEENPVALLGPSGCGKTTFLRLAAGLLEPRSGRIIYEDKEPENPGKGISFVFQEPRLLPWLTVRENVVLPIKKYLPPKDAESRAEHFLELVSLKDKIPAYPGALSGGQRQRVSIARAFTYPAALMFMDEPFQSLDIPLRIELMGTTLELLKAEPRFLIAVTHDPREAVFLGRRIIVLGKAPRGIIFDDLVPESSIGGAYASPESNALEARLLQILRFGL
ncbi:MAG: ABC transporter ATP-binding protein [Treponema sp.]|jgi:NitT/TauT family transport system ATP-binding protein|nr:ABC transporter ATP-binding protein [Treponema sp.]